MLSTHIGSYAPTVDPTLIADQRRFRAKYLQNGDELKSRSISFYLLQYHVIFHLYWFN